MSLEQFSPEPRQAQYRWGQQVVALVDLVNDGSHPDRDFEAVLVETGSEGEIVQVGHHADTNQPIYMVEFDGIVVGCLEEEILLCMELDDMLAEARGLKHAAPATAQASES
jgi:nitrogen fixation protein NifZ